jgi:carbonic anhydrase
MSCLNSTSPIDINKNNVSGSCDFKCSYNFQYINSSCVATNRGDYIELSYDNSSNPPVIYNDTGYNVREVRLYSPSIHTYNGKNTEGELIIVHTSIIGLNNLLVCIPIKINDVDAEDSKILFNIIKTIANNAPDKDEGTDVRILNYNLNTFVPEKPFYSYTGSLLYQPCGGSIDYIVFSPNEHYINISSSSFSTLIKLINPHMYVTQKEMTINLFYNSKGAKKNTSNNNIYIDCQPVGVDKNTIEEVVVTQFKTPSFTGTNIFKNQGFQLFLGILLFLVFFYIIFWLFNLFKTYTIGDTDNRFINKFMPKNVFK